MRFLCWPSMRCLHAVHLLPPSVFLPSFLVPPAAPLPSALLLSQQGTSSCRSVTIAKLATQLHMPENLLSWLHLSTSRHVPVARHNDDLLLTPGDTETSLCLESWLTHSVQLNSDDSGRGFSSLDSDTQNAFPSWALPKYIRWHKHFHVRKPPT